jgi:hypothetical protein
MRAGPIPTRWRDGVGHVRLQAMRGCTKTSVQPCSHRSKNDWPNTREHNVLKYVLCLIKDNRRATKMYIVGHPTPALQFPRFSSILTRHRHSLHAIYRTDNVTAFLVFGRISKEGLVILRTSCC